MTSKDKQEKQNLLIFKDIIREYNNGPDTITKIIDRRTNYSRNEFYLHCRKYNVIKDKKTKKYIFLDTHADKEYKNLLEIKLNPNKTVQINIVSTRT